MTLTIGDTGLRFISSLLSPKVETMKASFGSEVAEAASLSATLRMDGLAPVTVFYDPSTLLPDTEYTFSVPVDTSGLPSGRRHWQIDLVEHYTGAEPVVQRYEGDQELRNEWNSTLGKGVLLSGLDRLDLQADGASLATGDGSQIWFNKNLDGSFTTQHGDPTFSTLEYVSGSDEYVLTDKWGGVSRFNSSGLLTARVDTFGNATTFGYVDADSDGQADDIALITDPAGRETAYAYTAGLLASVTDFAGQVTTLDHDDGFLTGIIQPDPDGAGPDAGPTTSFTWDTENGRLDTMETPWEA